MRCKLRRFRNSFLPNHVHIKRDHPSSLTLTHHNNASKQCIHHRGITLTPVSPSPCCIDVGSRCEETKMHTENYAMMRETEKGQTRNKKRREQFGPQPFVVVWFWLLGEGKEETIIQRCHGDVAMATYTIQTSEHLRVVVATPCGITSAHLSPPFGFHF